MGNAVKDFIEANKVDPNATVQTDNVEQKEEQVGARSQENATEDVQETDFSKIPEEKLFGFLTGKVGKEVKNWEDLVTREEVVKEVQVPLQYASPDIEVIDKFVRETGRGVEDFFKVQKDWDSVPDEKVVMEHMKSKYGSLDDESINILFDESYGLEKITEDMDEDEVAVINRKNKVKLAKLKLSSAEARTYFNSQKEQYKTPIRQLESKVNEGKEAWQQNMQSALSNVTKLEKDGFVYEFRDRDSYNNTFKDIDSLLGSFKNQDGSFDYDTLARVIIAGREMPKILDEYAKAIKADTIEQELKKKSNANVETTRDAVSDNGEEQVRAILRRLGKRV